MAQSKEAPVDIKKYALKPSDIGYQTEFATEMTPTAKQTYGRTTNQQQSTSSTRPPLMIYPGE